MAHNMPETPTAKGEFRGDAGAVTSNKLSTHLFSEGDKEVL